MSTRRIIAAYCFVMFFLQIALLGTASASLGGSAYTEAVGRQSMYTLQAASARGTIYDRNMKPLTNASEKYIAAVIPGVETLSRLNAVTTDDQREELRTALENGKPFLTEVTSPVNTEGIATFTVFERYEENQPAANLIGYLESGETGADGVEKSFDRILSENEGEIRVTFTIDALGNAISGESMQVENTYRIADGGIVLTLDREIQTALEDACGSIQKGAAVILDCDTGELLASASFPAVDPNHLDRCLEDPDAPFVNRVLCAYAPGSVFKLFVAAAALEEGVDYQETYSCSGSIEVDGMEFACYDETAHGEVNMHTALRKSCNGYFVNLLNKIEPECVLRLTRSLGFAHTVELADGLQSDAGTLPTAQTLENARARANFSFGQGETTVSPLQLAAAVNAIAAGGVYTQPKVFLGTADTNLEVTEAEKNEACKVMEPTTANRLRTYMESTARFGTARYGAPENCTSGIKTGTAQTGVYAENGEEILNYWYAGYICGDDGEPTFTIVILEETAGESHVADAFRRIGETLVDFI
ncbi:MAG: peptidoglycan D,D-transpeptidase FtsI family protein [Hominenteromicrobium sp.]